MVAASMSGASPGAGRRVSTASMMLRAHADVADRPPTASSSTIGAQHVQRVELGLAALEREPAGALQDPLGAHGEEPAEVDRPGRRPARPRGSGRGTRRTSPNPRR
jgi:hypothetical protein